MFKLCATLAGHAQDVRAACALPTGHVVTCSRDATARLWAPAGPTAYTCEAVLRGHAHFVSAACYVPPGGMGGAGGGLATGSHDKLVLTYSLSDPATVVHTLVGHTEPVCALASSPDGTIISGSWDRTARLWSGGLCIGVLMGHEQAVWAVLVLENGHFVTGSADKTVRIWEGERCIRVVTAHSDCVRGLALVPGVGFLSCGNDSSLKLWTSGGDPLVEFHGHSSFVYGCAALSSSLYLSVGEDRTVRVWKADGSCAQAIHHPATSVWSVAALANGDFVTGSSDGLARVFSASVERQADAATVKLFEDEVARFSVRGESLGNINKKDLPGVEALAAPGSRDQQVRMVRQGGVVEAHQWSEAERRWVKVGEVVDAVGSTKQSLNGKEYDYVFDIDLGDGLPARKLGYNNTDNPWVVAQEFLHKEELSQYFLDQVANFIVSNSKPVMLEAAPSNDFVDPFTGAGRYVPGGFTPSKPAAAAPPPARKTSIYVFDSASAGPLAKKLAQLNESVPAALKLSEGDMRVLETVLPHIESADKVRRLDFGPQHLAVVDRVLEWPADMVFPAIDVVRMLVLNGRQSAAVASTQRVRRVLDTARVGADGAHEPAVMLALRFFSNGLATDGSAPAVLEATPEILRRVRRMPPSANKNVRLALVTFCANVASMSEALSESGAREDALAVLLQSLADESDADVLPRTLAGLSALVAAWRPAAARIAGSGGVQHLQRLLDNSSDSVRRAAADLAELVIGST